MHRCKTILLTLSLIIGFGLVSGCNKDDNADNKAPVEGSAAEGEGAEGATDEKKAEEPEDLPLEATGPVAEVNGESIGADKFNEAIQQSAGMMPPGTMNAQLAEMMKERTVDRLVDIALIDKALEEAKIEVSDKEVEEELASFKERLPDEETFKNFLEQRGLSEEVMKENIHKDLQLRELLKKKYGTEVTEKDASEFYAANEQRFEHEDQVHARHILIKVEKDADEATVEEAKKRAEEIAKEAKASGADFEALAKEKSEGPAGPRGGDLGFFTKERMVPQFSEAAFAMKTGEISDPVRSDFGFHVIQVVEKKEAGKTSFDEAKDEIMAELERQKFRESMGGFLEELHENAEIELKLDNIKVNIKEEEGAPQDPAAGGGLPPELQQQIQQQMQQQMQQQQQQGGDNANAPAELKLDAPKMAE